MTSKKIINIIIIAVCIFSIIIGTIFFFIVRFNKKEIETTNNQTEEYLTQEELKKNFYDIFNNQLNNSDYDISNIPKFDDSKNIVYTVYSANEKKDNYEVNLNLPIVNINSEVTANFNNITQEIFANKANDIYEGTDKKTIYSVTYTGFINGDILSVVIKSTLKEGNSAQRVIVQTYNYNLKTGKEATIYDVISKRELEESEVSTKIKNQIKEAIKEANDIQISGYEVYSRNINDDMYEVENTSTYYLGADGKLYIIYAYGNESFTSEMDIIVI